MHSTSRCWAWSPNRGRACLGVGCLPGRSLSPPPGGRTRGGEDLGLVRGGRAVATTSERTRCVPLDRAAGRAHHATCTRSPSGSSPTLALLHLPPTSTARTAPRSFLALRSLTYVTFSNPCFPFGNKSTGEDSGGEGERASEERVVQEKAGAAERYARSHAVVAPQTRVDSPEQNVDPLSFPSTSKLLATISAAFHFTLPPLLTPLNSPDAALKRPY